jgi:hypothetical protein
MAKAFQKINLCAAENPGGNGDKIPQWAEAHSGKYSKAATQAVTHLVATKEAYKETSKQGSFYDIGFTIRYGRLTHQ